MNNLGARASSPASCENAKKAAEDSRAPRGWHSRGYLPHFDGPNLVQSITYRLGDAVPAEVARRLASELDTPEPESVYRQRVEAYLHAGHGECWLRRPEIARIVLDSWHFFDGQRYDLIAWVIMPNHVHLLVGMRQTSLSDVVKGWKSYTSRRINRVIGRVGRLWQEDYWDRYIRNEQHYRAAIAYIHDNPVKAGLAPRAEDWPWSSLRASASSPAEKTKTRAAEDSRAPSRAKGAGDE